MAMEEPHNTTPKKKSCGLENDSIFGTIKKFTAPAGNSPKVSFCWCQKGCADYSPCYVPLQLPTIKDFCILKPISRGAFGKVFLGYKKNNDHDKLFAIKVMRKSDMINKNMISQVITERNALALSRSPFCVTLYYSLQTISSVFLVMEYMVGGDLKSLLAMYGFFEESAARFYTAEICLALQYLHKHGIVHRDIKPDNMLISATGHVKLTDFGLSRIEMRRDLEISDLINCSPNLNARTPGQLLSLTSHLSFGSHEKRQLEQPTDQLHQSSENDSDCSFSNSKQNDSKMSGVSPFFSAEQNGSVIEGLREVRATTPPAEKTADMTSSYYTCNSSVDGGRSSSTGSYESVGNGQVQVVVSVDGSNKENSDSNNKEARGEKAEQHSKNSFDFLLVSCFVGLEYGNVKFDFTRLLRKLTNLEAVKLL